MTNSLRPRYLSWARRGVSLDVASELAMVKFVGQECANGQTLNSSTWRLSWSANRSSLQSRRSRGAGLGLWRTVERWRSNAYQEGMVGDCTWTFFKESDVGESSVVSIVDALNDSARSRFYYDELQEAVVAIKNRAKEAEALDAFLPGRTEEKTVQSGEGADVKKFEAESESGNSNWDEGQDLWMKGKGKLPVESNGPPMVILQPYLKVSKNSQEQTTPKLRPLPLPMPHMSRSLSFPRVSLSHKLGIVSARKSILKSQVSYFTVKYLATDIRNLPVSAHVSEVLNKWVWRLKRGYLARTVRELAQMELKERALQVLFWLKNIPHLWPDHSTLCTVIQVMVEGGEVDTAFKLQRTMGSDSKLVAQSLAIALAKAGMLIEVVEVFKYIKQESMAESSRNSSKLPTTSRVGILRRIFSSIRLQTYPQKCRRVMNLNKIDQHN